MDHSPIAWREAGDGDPVLFMHGLGGSRLSWEPQLEGMASRWRCVAWDMPGYGASAPLRELSFDTVADSAAQLIKRLSPQPAHVIGLSFGGQQAQHLALRYPRLVRSLVLVNTSPAFGIDGTDPVEWVSSRTKHDQTTPEAAEEILRSIAAAGFEGLELRRSIRAFTRISPSALSAACHCLVNHDLRNRLCEIAAPTMVVVGDSDEETPPSYSQMLADGIPEAELATIVGCGHLCPAEAPDTFNQLVIEFLSNLV